MVEGLKSELKAQSEAMNKLQEEINSLLSEHKNHRHDEAKYLKKELRDLNKNFSSQLQALQSNIESTTTNLKEMQD